jgi:hypothetical protein
MPKRPRKLRFEDDPESLLIGYEDDLVDENAEREANLRHERGNH